MQTIPDQAGSGRMPRVGIGELLAHWQAAGDTAAFGALITAIHGPLVRLAARTLRRSGIRDPAACEDAVDLVLERLFRLGIPGGGQPLHPFSRSRVGRSAAVDPGWAYVRCVTRSRARDVARAMRRRDRLVARYATLVPRRAPDDEHAGAARDVERLRAALATLDARSHEVIGLLLDGKSQSVIAHVLGVSEGTVSRIRAKAIARLREVLATHDKKKRGGGG